MSGYPQNPRRLHWMVLGLLLPLACKDGEAPHESKGAMPAQATPGSSGIKAGARGLDASGRMQISEGDRCPVCGMRASKHKKFASAIQLKDDRVFYFCGTGCMIKSWLHPQRFLGSGKETLSRAVTREYFGGAHVDALKVHWIAGSDVVGAMGPALVPLKDEGDLATFKKRHGGRVTFRLGELSGARFRAITGKAPGGKK